MPTCLQVILVYITQTPVLWKPTRKAPTLLLPLLPGGKFIGMLSLLPVFLVKSRNLFLCRIVSFKNSGHTFEKIHVGWTELVMVGRLLVGNVVSGYKCFLSLPGVNFLYWWIFGGCCFFFCF